MGFRVTQKGVRDRFKLLVEQCQIGFARFGKMPEEKSASVIDPEESELDKACESIVELVDEYEQQYYNDTCEKQKKEVGKRQKDYGRAQDLSDGNIWGKL